ncbi:MAG: hypothetical protein JKX84_02605 [Flavobacteriales bacterium]|nr:hypothetical protein [Flavobacteriales bacterium]
MKTTNTRQIPTGLFSVFLTFCVLAFSSLSAFAQQDYYYTVDGKMMINASINDSAISVVSKKVTVLIDYDTGEFLLTFDVSTLKTGDRKLDSLLMMDEGHLIRYEGKFGIDHVPTESHPPLDFLVEGYINCSYHNDFIQGRGTLQHLYDATYSCYLNLSFDIALDQLPFDIPIEGLDERVQIEIIQMVLNQNSSGSRVGY